MLDRIQNLLHNVSMMVQQKDMSLIKLLDKVGKEVNMYWPLINHGGCCVYASIIAKRLEKINIPVKGIVASGAALDINETLGQVRKKVGKQTGDFWMWEDHGVVFGHVGLEFKYNGRLYQYDSNGCHLPADTLDGFPLFRGRMHVAELHALAGKARGWNTSFDRSEIPTIRKLVKSHFKGYKKD